MVEKFKTWLKKPVIKTKTKPTNAQIVLTTIGLILLFPLVMALRAKKKK
jgi:hypothetical protein